MCVCVCGYVFGGQGGTGVCSKARTSVSTRVTCGCPFKGPSQICPRPFDQAFYDSPALDGPRDTRMHAGWEMRLVGHGWDLTRTFPHTHAQRGWALPCSNVIHQDFQSQLKRWSKHVRGTEVGNTHRECNLQHCLDFHSSNPTHYKPLVLITSFL